MSLRIAAIAMLAALLATCAGDDLARAAAEAGRPGTASPPSAEVAGLALAPRARHAKPAARAAPAASFATVF
jgi:hypothetical protein